MVLVKRGQVVTDPWQHLADDATLPDVGPVTVSWKRWSAERDILLQGGIALGLRLPNDVPPGDLGGDANRFGLITVSFPNFGDGRAFSQARLLRGRLGFRGELRAMGNVLRDLLLFMQRCGIDAFEVEDRAMTENWFAALQEIDVFYQPAEDNRPWVARQRLKS